MWLVVGLGNPGSEYAGSRHNAGFEALDVLAERCAVSISEKKFKARLGRGSLEGHECVFIKPQTFMNLSGESVGAASGFYKVPTSQIIVIHDDLDLGVARLMLKKGGGHGGHNGLRSILAHVPDPGFIRARIGIGRPPPRWVAVDYVLSRFQGAEQEQMKTVYETTADAVCAIIRDGLPRAMNLHNRLAKAPDDSE